MQAKSPAKRAVLPHRIEINLRDVRQLFNTMDPSPFRDKDLARDAEEFIVSWANEFPANEPLMLVLHLHEEPASGENQQQMAELGVRNYFAYLARLNKAEFRQLMKKGWQSLLIGLLFLTVCLTLSGQMSGWQPDRLWSLLRESLVIGGWVAMWRPLEIYLYDWWPLRQRGRVYEKLSRMPVEIAGREPG